jgi:NAD(P)-dependent dehydrogenase (short-subunit alcohol dehydrogenase family)
MSEGKRVAVVTGAGRREGLGFEVCKQLAARGFAVVLTARDREAIEARRQDLAALGLEVYAERLDVADSESVAAFARSMEHRFGRVDVLINNAAGTTALGEAPSATHLEQAHASMEVTLFGAWRMIQALFSLLCRGTHSRVVNVSSGAGSHGDPVFGLTTKNAMGPAYAVSKAALNALTVTFANELRDRGVLVNAVCPGFTATFPGGESMGARPVADGAAGIVWAAVLDDDGPTGGFFRDGKPLPW